jgi:hypothetical protein
MTPRIWSFIGSASQVAEEAESRTEFPKTAPQGLKARSFLRHVRHD